MNRILIDGKDLSSDVTDGLSSLELEYGRSDSSYNYSTSSTITFDKNGFNLIWDKFFSSCTDIANKCKAAIHLECCGKWIEAEITNEDVEVCPTDCSASVTVSSLSPYKKCYDTLCNTFLGELGYSEKATLYKLHYADSARIIKRKTGTYKGEDVYQYNYPLSLTKIEDDDKTITKGMLYDFWKSANPNLSGRELYEVKDLKFQMTCEELNSLDSSDYGYYINTPYSRANINLLTVEVDSLTAMVETAKIRC